MKTALSLLSRPGQQQEMSRRPLIADLLCIVTLMQWPEDHLSTRVCPHVHNIKEGNRANRE